MNTDDRIKVGDEVRIHKKKMVQGVVSDFWPLARVLGIDHSSITVKYTSNNVYEEVELRHVRRVK